VWGIPQSNYKGKKQNKQHKRINKQHLKNVGCVKKHREERRALGAELHE
jgi:hypothetical protein